VWSHYQTPARPHGGEPLAIDESVWIYSRRHARGLAYVRDWARTMNIDIDINGARFSTEDGILDLHPALKVEGPGAIRIHNTGQQADATVQIVVWIRAAGPELVPAGQSRPCAMGTVHDIKPNRSALLDVSECRHDIQFDDKELPPMGVFVGAVRYRVFPVESPTKLTRLFGRPEWE
jgi:hypothetical protein